MKKKIDTKSSSDPTGGGCAVATVFMISGFAAFGAMIANVLPV